jgi:hypothetical protein
VNRVSGFAFISQSQIGRFGSKLSLIIGTTSPPEKPLSFKNNNYILALLMKNNYSKELQSKVFSWRIIITTSVK